MENFTWIEPFEKISRWLFTFKDKREELVPILQSIGIKNGLYDEPKEKILLQDIDPFSFIAQILKHSNYDNRNTLLKKLKESQNLSFTLPKNYSGVPNVIALKANLFAFKAERNVDDISHLWKLFEAIHEGTDLSEFFDATLEINQTAIGKLTQMMFVLFPRRFFPLDSQTKNWLVSSGLLSCQKNIKWKQYYHLINTLKYRYKTSLPQLSYTCWFINEYVFNQETAAKLLGIRLRSVSNGVAYIQGFETSEKKQIALEVNQRSAYFNILGEERIPEQLNINSEFRHVGNSNLKKHAPQLADKNICVIRTHKSFDWFNFLAILDWYESGIVPLFDHHLSQRTKEQQHMNIPLNQILSGPPGTGKTYATTEFAVQIAVPEWYKNLVSDHNKREKIKAKYDELIDKKQIAFTTFHQSFAYEDFIEGLKAYIPENEDKIAYKVEDGIFKRVAIAATKALGVSHSESLGLNLEPTIWKISLGERWENERQQRYFENNQARIGWNGVGDLTKDRIEKQQKYYDSLTANTHNTLSSFSTTMKVGDVLLCLKDQNTVQAIGIVKSDYYFDSNTDDDYVHVRDMDWILKDINFNILDLNHQTVLVQKTVYELKRMSWSKIVEELKKQNIVDLPSIEKNKNENYVLVIDEINRGNISKIFGELITLIEEDKRGNQKDARELILPYSKEPFSVPSNLYLIGTMNTADKSLTQLDLALRRRFEFKEILPDGSLLTSANQYDVDIVRLLNKVNQRIQYLKGKDFQIGHAYFMPLCEKFDSESDYIVVLKRILLNKVLPLLQEYFFSHLSHIGLVLNDNPQDEQSKKIIIETHQNSLFPFAETLPKVNPLYAIQLNMACFDSIQRIKQIYAE